MSSDVNKMNRSQHLKVGRKNVPGRKNTRCKSPEWENLGKLGSKERIPVPLEL